jgi:hypothetical protein
MPTTKQLQFQKLSEIILDRVFEDANMLGEILLDYSFVGEGRGCYSNFELRDCFREYSSGRDQFADRFIGEGDLFDTYEYAQEIEGIKSYINPEIELIVCWNWSGDGHLIFKLGPLILENTDIKKSYNWKFVS